MTKRNARDIVTKKLIQISDETSSDSPEYREVIQALGNTGSKPATKKLVEIYDGSSDPQEHKTVIQALGNTGNKLAVKKLIEIYDGSSDSEERKAALRALGEIGKSNLL